MTTSEHIGVERGGPWPLDWGVVVEESQGGTTVYVIGQDSSGVPTPEGSRRAAALLRRAAAALDGDAAGLA